MSHDDRINKAIDDIKKVVEGYMADDRLPTIVEAIAELHGCMVEEYRLEEGVLSIRLRPVIEYIQVNLTRPVTQDDTPDW